MARHYTRESQVTATLNVLIFFLPHAASRSASVSHPENIRPIVLHFSAVNIKQRKSLS